MLNAEELRVILSMELKDSRKLMSEMNRMNNSFTMIRRNMSSLAQASQALTMEFLGLMFFGMMLQRTFMGLLKPAMDAFGVMDLWQTMLLTLFIPIMEEIFPLFLKFVQYFMNMDDSQKKLIGTFVLLMAGLGTFLMLLGQLGLGIFSIIRFVEFVIPLFKLLGITVSGAFATVLAVVTAILIGIWLAWKDNFGKIKGHFSAVIEGIKTMLEGLKKMFTGDFAQGLEYFIRGQATAIVSSLSILGLGLLRFLVMIGNFVLNIFKGLFGHINDMTHGWAYRFINILLKIASVINNILEKVGSIPGLGGLSTISKINTGTIENVRNFIGSSQPVGATQVLNITNNITVSDKAEMERMIDGNNRKVVDDLLRLLKVPA